MKPKVLKTEAEYEAAVKRVEALMDARPNTPRADELELWTLLAEQYEEKHHPIDPPDPVEAIRFRMDQMGLKQVDLVPYIGAPSKVSEVLNRKRPLSLPMIRRLNEGLGIPARALIGRSEQKAKPKARGRRRAIVSV